MYVYRRYKETAYWEVGYFDPAGCWHQESMWSSQDRAAEQTNWLNGERKRLQEDREAREYSQWRAKKINGLKCKKIFLSDLSQQDRLEEHCFYEIAILRYIYNGDEAEIQKAKTVLEYDYLCANEEQRRTIRRVYRSFFHDDLRC